MKPGPKRPKQTIVIKSDEEIEREIMLERQRKINICENSINVKHIYFHFIWIGNPMKCECNYDHDTRNSIIKHCIQNIIKHYRKFLPMCQSENKNFKIIIHTDVLSFGDNLRDCMNNEVFEHIIINYIDVKEILDRFFTEDVTIQTESTDNSPQITLNLKLSDFLFGAFYGEKKIYMAISDIIRIVGVGNYSIDNVEYQPNEYIMNLYIDTDEFLVCNDIKYLYCPDKYAFFNREYSKIKNNNDILGFLYSPYSKELYYQTGGLTFDFFRNSYIKQMILHIDQFVNKMVNNMFVDSILEYTGIKSYKHIINYIYDEGFNGSIGEKLFIEGIIHVKTGEEIPVSFQKEYIDFFKVYLLSLSLSSLQTGGKYKQKYIKYINKNNNIINKII
jgi:hypothetical protein